jgi:hypothetical protein
VKRGSYGLSSAVEDGGGTRRVQALSDEPQLGSAGVDGAGPQRHG